MSQDKPAQTPHRWLGGQIGIDPESGGWFVCEAERQETVAGVAMHVVQGRNLAAARLPAGSYMVANGAAAIARLTLLSPERAAQDMDAALARLVRPWEVRHTVSHMKIKEWTSSRTPRRWVISPLALAGGIAEVSSFLRFKNEGATPGSYHDVRDLLDRLIWTFAHLAERVYGGPARSLHERLNAVLVPTGTTAPDEGDEDTTADNAVVKDASSDTPKAADGTEAPKGRAARDEALAHKIRDAIGRDFSGRIMLVQPSAARPKAASAQNSLIGYLKDNGIRRDLPVSVSAKDVPPRAAPALPAPVPAGVTPATLVAARSVPAPAPAPRPAAAKRAPAPVRDRASFVSKRGEVDYGWFTVEEWQRGHTRYNPYRIAGSDLMLESEAHALLQILADAPDGVEEAAAITLMRGRTAYLTGLRQLRTTLEKRLGHHAEPAARTPVIVHRGVVRLRRPDDGWIPVEDASEVRDTVMGPIVLREETGRRPQILAGAATASITPAAAQLLHFLHQPKRAGQIVPRAQIAQTLRPQSPSASGMQWVVDAHLEVTRALGAVLGAASADMYAAIPREGLRLSVPAADPAPSYPAPSDQVVFTRESNGASATLSYQGREVALQLPGAIMADFLSRPENAGRWVSRQELARAVYSHHNNAVAAAQIARGHRLLEGAFHALAGPDAASMYAHDRSLSFRFGPARAEQHAPVDTRLARVFALAADTLNEAEFSALGLLLLQGEPVRESSLCGAAFERHARAAQDKLAEALGDDVEMKTWLAGHEIRSTGPKPGGL